MSLVFINCTGETFTPTRSGAISTWVWEMCRAARERGIEPWVITRSAEADTYPWGRTVVLEYPRIPTIRGTGIGRLLVLQRQLGGWGHVRQKAYALRVVRVIRDRGLQRFPLFLHNDPEMAVFLRRCFPGATIVHHFHNTNPCSDRFRRAFPKAVSFATGVSDFVCRWQEAFFGFESGTTRTIYNGVDADRFTPAAELPAGDPVINFVGRTDATKAPDLLLRAARKVAERTKSFSVQILGARFYWGSEPDDYQRLLDQLAFDLVRDGIAVRRPGLISRNALPDELRKAQIHVVPSRWEEPFGLVALEGMACGLPTVASRSGGLPEVIDNAGFLVARDSVDELAAVLSELVLHERLRSDYAAKARARAEALTWRQAWMRLSELLELGRAVPAPEEAVA